MPENHLDNNTQPHSDDDFLTQPHSDNLRTQPHSDPYRVLIGDLLVGGRYKVMEILGGGMGMVYKCEDLETRLTVALKTVHTEGVMTESEEQAMKRSFVRVHRLNHRHIIRVNHIERDAERERWFVSMDWVDGEDLETRLRKQPGGHLPADETVRILEQIATALDYAHGEGIIHRDVKCANIMIQQDGNALLIDFGIAGRAPTFDMTPATQRTFGLTATVNPFTGTLGYQPPEQWLGDKTYAASDQYSLAVTAYRCLSGHLPFESRNEGELREMVMYDEPPRIRVISDAANIVLKKALSKNEKDRYGSCAEFIRELAQGLSTSALPPQPALTTQPQPSQTPNQAPTFQTLAAEPPSPKVTNNVEMQTGEDIMLDFNGVSLKLKKVHAGTFMMGSTEGFSDEEPVHNVTLTKDFWIGETEVTQNLYLAVMGNNPSKFKKGGNYPVENISWDDAMMFCRKLTELERAANRLHESYEYSLPTEAQWEYAARGGNKSKGYRYSGSGNLDEVGWYSGNADGSPHPVGQKKPNELGLYDMSGNIYEWCKDNCKLSWWTNNIISYTYHNDIVDPCSYIGSYHIIRGGSCFSSDACCRSAYRNSDTQSNHSNSLGIRLVLIPIQ